MARKRMKPEVGFRITNTVTGETGTVMYAYDPVKGHEDFNLSVLPDAGRKRTVIWKNSESDWKASTLRKCHRCGEDDHRVGQCPYGDLGAHLTLEARTLLEGLGYDPRRIPGPNVGGPEGYDGVRLWTNDKRQDLHRAMRNRVCVYEEVVIDGHEFRDGACSCGERESA